MKIPAADHVDSLHSVPPLQSIEIEEPFQSWLPSDPGISRKRRSPTPVEMKEHTIEEYFIEDQIIKEVTLLHSCSVVLWYTDCIAKHI